MSGRSDIERAEQDGYDDAKRGIPAESYPFEYADGELRDAWLRGWNRFGAEQREERS